MDGGPNHDTVGVTHLPVASAAARAEAEDILLAFSRASNKESPLTSSGQHPHQALQAASKDVRTLVLHEAMRRTATIYAAAREGPIQAWRNYPDMGLNGYTYATLGYVIERGARSGWLTTQADYAAMIEWWDTAVPANYQESTLPLMLAALARRPPLPDAKIAAWCERALDIEATSKKPNKEIRAALMAEREHAKGTKVEARAVSTKSRIECSADAIKAIEKLERGYLAAAKKQGPFFRNTDTLQGWADALKLPREQRRALALKLAGRFPAIATRVRADAEDTIKAQLEYQPAEDVDPRGIVAWWNVHVGYPDLTACSTLLSKLLANDLLFSQREWVQFLGDIASFDYIALGLSHQYMNALIGRLERSAPSLGDADEKLAAAIDTLAKRIGECSSNAPQRKAEARLNAIAQKIREVSMSTSSTRASSPTLPAPSKEAVALVEELRAITPTKSGERPKSHRAVKAFWNAPAELRREACCVAMELLPSIFQDYQAAPKSKEPALQHQHFFSFVLLNEQVELAIEKDHVWNLAELRRMFAWWHDGCRGNSKAEIGRRIVSIIERTKVHREEDVRTWIRSLSALIESSFKPSPAYLARLRNLLGDAPQFRATPGEVWSEAAGTDIAASPAGGAWVALFEHASTASSADPSKAWSKAALEHLKAVKQSDFTDAMQRWLPLIDKPRTTTLREGSYTEYREGSLVLTERGQLQLKGLCWMMGLVAADASAARSSRRPDLARLLGRTAISAYRKVPGLGPRATKVGNAAVTALGMIPGMDSLGQLAVLRIKVKFGTAQKMIEKALLAAAAREKLPREEIDELSVPSYGLTDVGLLEEVLGETNPANQITASLIVAGVGDVELRFTKGGKVLKSIPAAVKSEHADTLKELKATQKDLAAMIGAQRERLDSLFLENKTWDYAIWRERYLDHPVVGVLARRLIWRVRASATAPWRSVTHLQGQGLCDVQGRPVEIVEQGAHVRLWHPIEVDAAEALAWRRFFEDRELRQPFKQAHREVYLLTDAERRTGTYSNRYAAHVIKQHQFNALALVRGWKNKLRLLVDAEYPPASRTLNAFALRAEFWIEGMGDDYGTDTNDAGVYNHLATDQVRFYPIEAAPNSAHAGGGGYANAGENNDLNNPIPLDQIPALVLSEILRDVDLFVGVCSVGNNAQWQDGGPNGTFREYWWSYSFGELTQSGDQRRELLERLIPRLAIAPKCSFSGKFLIVKGDLRTYKIHLGSGNILMEPNDQYLCIVPGSSRGADPMTRFLPFEGDRILSLILSKAMMLAADTKITDTSIMWQIRGR
jgi:hypothetical protein